MVFRRNICSGLLEGGAGGRAGVQHGGRRVATPQEFCRLQSHLTLPRLRGEAKTPVLTKEQQAGSKHLEYKVVARFKNK